MKNRDEEVAEWIRKGSQMPQEDEIEYIRRMIDRGDLQEIHEMVKFWRSVKVLGAFAGAARRVVIGTAILLTSLALVSESVREGLRKWLGF